MHYILERLVLVHYFFLVNYQPLVRNNLPMKVLYKTTPEETLKGSLSMEITVISLNIFSKINFRNDYLPMYGIRLKIDA